MFQRRRKYLFSLLVIGSIMMLSFKDSLNVVHSLLHQIPNPFHYHVQETSSFYYRHQDPRASFFSHGHTHSVEDHVNNHTSDKKLKTSQKEKSQKKVMEKSSKTNLFLENHESMTFHFFVSAGLRFTLLNTSYFSTSQNTPPSPPPEIAA